MTPRFVSFRSETGKRLKKLAGFNEGIADGPGRPWLREWQGKLFLTTTTITARTGTSTPWTPGSGTATLLEFYDDSGTLKLRSTSISVTLRHMSTSSIASGRIVQAKWVDGQWLIDVDYC